MKLAFKITVGGCRDFNDSEYIFKCLDEYIKELCDEEIIIISGHCSGVDAIAEKYAGTRNSLILSALDKYAGICYTWKTGRLSHALYH